MREDERIATSQQRPRIYSPRPAVGQRDLGVSSSERRNDRSILLGLHAEVESAAFWSRFEKRQLALLIQALTQTLRRSGLDVDTQRRVQWSELRAFASRFGTHMPGKLAGFAVEGSTTEETLAYMTRVQDLMPKGGLPAFSGVLRRSPEKSILPTNDRRESSRALLALNDRFQAEWKSLPHVLADVHAPALSVVDIRLALLWTDRGKMGHHTIPDWSTFSEFSGSLYPNSGAPYWEAERCLSARRAELFTIEVRRALGEQVTDLSVLQQQTRSDERWRVADLLANDAAVDVKNSRFDRKERHTWQQVKRFKSLRTGQEVMYDGVRSKKVATLHEYGVPDTQGNVIYLGSTTQSRLKQLALLAPNGITIEVERYGDDRTLLPGWCFELPAAAYARHRKLADAWNGLRTGTDVREQEPLGEGQPYHWKQHSHSPIFDGALSNQSLGMPERESMSGGHARICEQVFLLSFGGPIVADGNEALDETLQAIARQIAEIGRWPAVLILGLLRAFLSQLQGGSQFSSIQPQVLFYPSPKMPLWVHDPTESVKGLYATLKELLAHADSALRGVTSLRLVSPQQLQGIKDNGEHCTLVVNCGKCQAYPLIRGKASPCEHPGGRLRCSDPVCKWCPCPDPSRIR